MLWLEALEDRCLDRTGSRKLTVGRSPANDLVLPDPDVSSYHALIEWRRAAWYVRDLDSRNGTYQAGRRVVGWVRLAEGDELRFGEAARFRVAEATPPGRAEADEAPTWTQSSPGAHAGLQVRLRPGATGGVLEVERGCRHEELELGMPFDVLLLLAQARVRSQNEGWVRDDELRRALWGKAQTDRTAEALYRHVRIIRESFRQLGLDERLIRKDRGRTRLELPPTSIQVPA